MKIILSRNRRQGFIWFVVGLLVIVVGAVMIYSLAQVAHRLLPPTQQQPPQGTNGTQTNQSATLRRPSIVAPSGETTAAETTPCFTFSLQYGFARNEADAKYVWLVPGTNLVTVTGGGLEAGVIIYRSPDLLQWEPVFTNAQCLLDSVQTFTDTNAPVVAAFYLISPQ